MAVSDIRDTLEPLGVDWHEESKLEEKEAIWKGEIYPIFRALVGQHSRNFRDAYDRRQAGLGADAEKKEKEPESGQSKREKILAEKIMASRPAHLQDDEPE